VSNYLLNAALKGILEGFTEFLPISSTGHLVLVRDLLPIAPAEHAKRLNELFDIIVQFPAVLAIVVLYWSRLWQSVSGIASRPEARRFWFGIALAFIPLAALGIVFKKTIEDKLMHPVPVAIALIVGGLILILIERRRAADRIEKAEDVTPETALIIGFFQALALIPGTSRSGATIVGGRLFGLTRFAAAEFSFFLAIPVMAAAFGYKFIQEYKTIQHGDGPILIVGCVTSFITAYIVVAVFIKFLQKHSLAAFGWYRIILGALVLIFASKL
jgi:undecaprenyl-diphosphatase